MHDMGQTYNIILCLRIADLSGILNNQRIKTKGVSQIEKKTKVVGDIVTIKAHKHV